MWTPRGQWRGDGPPPVESYLPSDWPVNVPAPEAMIAEATRRRDEAWRAAEGDDASIAEFPPLMEQAANLARAVGRFVASGMKTTTPEEQARRLAICGECPHFSPVPPGRCTLCGCVTQLVARVASKDCPDSPPRW